MSQKNLVQRLFQRILPTGAALIVLFAALYLASDATRGLTGFSDYYLWVFALVGTALLILAAAIGQRIWRLTQQLRGNKPGARLTLRLVIIFVALAVPPASIVYWFSVDFLNRSVDSWFDVDVEGALDDALAIGQSFLDVQKLSAQNQVRRLARGLRDSSNSRIRNELRDLLAGTRALELTVFDESGQIIGTRSTSLVNLQPDIPHSFLLVQAARSGSYVAAEPVDEGRLQIRALASIGDRGPGTSQLVLQAIYPVEQGFDEQAYNVEQQYEQYQYLSFLRSQLKRSFVLILSLVLLLSVLLAVLLAFNTAKKMTAPISRLSEATQSIAAGDYDRQLPVPSNDELGFLVQSFNTMTREIAQASAAATLSRDEAEQRRDYLAAVLGRLSSGVMSFDIQQRLMTCNPAASQILGVDLDHMLGKSATELYQHDPNLEPLIAQIEMAADATEWRQEVLIDRDGRQQVLMCRGARLGPLAGGGEVIVFDDLTDLATAQREAAWGEVARRLAHEVKNPLTPIQLAAERIRHKYLSLLDAEAAEVLDRSTRTIVTQVEALKTMVNAFSEYARAPTLQLEPLQLSELADEVIELYRQSAAAPEISTEWMTGEPRVFADRGRIRQLLHNLIKNAQEAAEPKVLKLSLATHVEWQAHHAWLCLSLRDNGPGLPEELIANIFEPYATTKARGTGIGLAIVRKIAEEHGGRIAARNARNGGAIFELRLPAEAVEQAAGHVG